jgi:hypothetical protein
MTTDKFIANTFFMLKDLPYPVIQGIMEAFYITAKTAYPDYYVQEGRIEMEDYQVALKRNLNYAWVRKSFGEDYKFDDGSNSFFIGLWANGCLVNIGMFDGYWFLDIDGIEELDLSIIQSIVRKHKLQNIL